ncbi:MAG: SDR family NAD(P)-dependent oxidoreductase [Gammaproteobacteria bacterium]
MNKVLTGRRALVTGGGQGLGRVFAQALADAGAGLVICGRRAEVLAQAAAELRGGGAQVLDLPCDVTRPEQIAALKDAAGPIDILVNNAGYSIRRNSWLEVTLAEWREVTGINIDAPFLMAQAFAPGMVERGWGRIVNVSSIYGTVAANPGHYPGMLADNASYMTSKHAIIGLTKHLAAALGGTGVNVNVISPGLFPGLSRRDRSDGNTRASTAMDLLQQATPLHRFGVAEDLREAIVLLAGPGSAFMTGQNLVIDGGFGIW